MSNPIFGKHVARVLRRRTAGLGFLDERPPVDHQPRSPPASVVRDDPRTPSIPRAETRFFCKPDTGLATREPATRNAGTSRSSLIFADVKIFQESEMERHCAIRFAAHRGVRQIHSQYPVLPWTAADGVDHEHTCDFYLIYEDGWRQAVVVKQEKKRPLMEDMIRRIRTRGISHVADEIVLLTESFGNHATAANAKWILWSRKHFDQTAVESLRAAVALLHGPFRFGDLMRGCDDRFKRRVAIWALLDLGLLIAPVGERVTELTWLVRAAAH